MKQRKKLTQKEYDYIYSKVPRICIDLFITSDKGILLTKRNIAPDKGLWHFPGGGIRFEENLQEAAIRIAKEELGINVKPLEMIGEMEFLNRKVHSVSIVFLVKIISGKIKLDFQASEFKFWDKMPKGIVKEHRNFIKEFFL